MSEPTDLLSAEEELFRAYLDDELGPTESRALEERLAKEPELQVALDEYAGAVRMLRTLAPTPAPATLLPEVTGRVSSRAFRSRMEPQLKFPYEALVFVALMTGILYVYFALAAPGLGPITKRGKPVLLEVAVPEPPPVALIERFGLQEAATGRGEERGWYARLDRTSAAELLRELGQSERYPLSPGAELFGVLLLPSADQ